jgi:hypothetical protein
MVKQWIDKENLVPLNLLYQQLPSNTYLNFQDAYSSIDYIMIQNKDDWSDIIQLNIVTSENEHKRLTSEINTSKEWHKITQENWDTDNRSDHRPIAIEFILTEDVTKNNKDRQIQNINWNDKKIQKQYRSQLNEEINKTKLSEYLMRQPKSSIEAKIIMELLYRTMMKTVENTREILIQVLNDKKKKLHHKYKKSKEYWTDELEDLHNRRQEAVIQWRKTKRIEYQYLMKSLKYQFKKLVKIEKRKMEDKKAIRLVKIYNEDKNIKFWIEIKKRSKISSTHSIELKSLYTHYKKLFTEKLVISEDTEYDKTCEIDLKTNIDKAISSPPITPIKSEQIKSILKSLKNGKSPGKRGIKNEFFKYAIDTLVPNTLAKIFETMFNFDIRPNGTNVGKIITLIKDINGDLGSTDNIRPITLSDVFDIIYEKLLMSYQNTKLQPQQFGFRQNSSTSHAIYILRENMRRIKQRKTKGFAIFMDFSKAFDKVNHTKLLVKIKHKWSQRIWLSLVRYYQNATLFVYDKNEGYSESFEPKYGVKQGGQLSPGLYNEYIDELIDIIVKSKLTVEINGTTTGIIVYADDTTIVVTSIANGQAVLNLVSKYCNKNEIQINAKKTVWMKINEPIKHNKVTGEVIMKPEIIGENFFINNEKLNKCAKFKFLGYNVSSNLSNKEHLTRKISSAYASIEHVNTLGFNNTLISDRIKGVLYNTFTRSKLTYALENATLNQSDINKLIRVEGQIIKKAFNLSNNSYTSPLLKAMKITSIAQTIEKRKLTLIQQLVTNELTCRIIMNNESGHYFEKTLSEIGYVYDHTRTGGENLSNIYGRCENKIYAINKEGEVNPNDIYTSSIEYLLNNRSKTNDETFRYLIQSKYHIREWTNNEQGII